MKKYFTGIFALALALSLSAFTAMPDSTGTDDVKWFVFEGDPGEEGMASRYSVISAPSCVTNNEEYLCEIHIQVQSGNPNLPDLSATPLEVRTKSTP